MLNLIKQKLIEDGAVNMFQIAVIKKLFNITIIKSKNRDGNNYYYIIAYNNNCILNTKEYNKINFKDLRITNINDSNIKIKLELAYNNIFNSINLVLDSIINDISKLDNTISIKKDFSKIITLTLTYKDKNKIKNRNIIVGDIIRLYSEYDYQIKDFIKPIMTEVIYE